MQNSLLTDESGEPVGMIGAIRDITKEKNTRLALMEAQKLLHLALDGGGIGIWDWNLTTGGAVFDERWAQILGYSVDELTPHLSTWEKLIHQTD